MRRTPLNADHTRPHGSDGTPLDLDSWAHSYVWNGDGTMQYDQVTDGTSSWRKTYSWDAGKMIGETVWVKQ